MSIQHTKLFYLVIGAVYSRLVKGEGEYGMKVFRKHFPRIFPVPLTFLSKGV